MFLFISILPPVHALCISIVFFSVWWAVVLFRYFFVYCLSFSYFFTVTLYFFMVTVFHDISVFLIWFLYPYRKRWDLDLSSRCVVNPGWLSPSCFNQDPFSPVCVSMNLSVCLSDCGWWDVECRFLWPVLGPFTDTYATAETYFIKVSVSVDVFVITHLNVLPWLSQPDCPELNLSHFPPQHRKSDWTGLDKLQTGYKGSIFKAMYLWAIIC